MFCSNCGSNLNNEEKFCVICGREVISSPNTSTSADVKSVPKKSKGKYFLFAVSGMLAGAVILTAIFWVTGLITFSDTSDAGNIITNENTIEGPGFSKPEDAAKAYLKALKNQDLDGMISTFAVESYVDHYDLEASLERLQAYQIKSNIKLPNTTEYCKQLNIAACRDQIVNQIMVQYMLYNTTGDRSIDETLTLNDKKAIQDFVAAFEKDTKNYVFDDLKITGTMKPEELSEVYLSEQNQTNIARQVKCYGLKADDVVNVVITFTANGKSGMFCPQVIRYNNRWYIQPTLGNLANILGWNYYSGGIGYTN